MNLDQIITNELDSKTLTQLREIAKELDIKSVSKYKKNELIELIESKQNITQEKKIEKEEQVESKSYVKPYEKRNTDINTENRYQRNENKLSNTEYTNTRNNKGYYIPKVVEESKIVDEFNTSKDEFFY